MSPFPRAQREIHSVFTLCITPMSKKATQRRNPVAQKKGRRTRHAALARSTLDKVCEEIYQGVAAFMVGCKVRPVSFDR
jgi:hypothetical protein